MWEVQGFQAELIDLMTAKLPITSLARTAHDMRTLLTLLQADLLHWQDKIKEYDASPNMVSEATAMYTHTQRLGDLLGSLLLQETQQVERKVFDLDQLMRTVLDTYRQSFPGVKFIHSTEHVALISGKEEEIKTVIQNILENALKYGQNRDGDPIVHCRLERIGKKYQLTITDQGTGIARQDLNKVFIPFFRGKNAEIPGSGLGLAIAREIVLHHNGRITIKSVVNQGTEVIVVLPVT